MSGTLEYANEQDQDARRGCLLTATALAMGVVTIVHAEDSLDFEVQGR